MDIEVEKYAGNLRFFFAATMADSQRECEDGCWGIRNALNNGKYIAICDGHTSMLGGFRKKSRLKHGVVGQDGF